MQTPSIIRKQPSSTAAVARQQRGLSLSEQFSPTVLEHLTTLINTESSRIASTAKQRFGFIKLESLYGTENSCEEGVLNGDYYSAKLREHVEAKQTRVSSNNSSSNIEGITLSAQNMKKQKRSCFSAQPRSRSVLSVMEEHINHTSHAHREFLESTFQHSQTVSGDSTSETKIINSLTSYLEHRSEKSQISSLLKSPSSFSPHSPTATPSDQSSAAASKANTQVQRGKQLQEERKQRATKNRKEMRSRLNVIIEDHEKVTKQLDYVYSDTTEATKQAQIIKQGRKLETEIAEIIATQGTQSDSLAAFQMMQSRMSISMSHPNRRVSSFIQEDKDLLQNSMVNSVTNTSAQERWTKIELQRIEIKDMRERAKNAEKLHFEPYRESQAKDLLISLQDKSNKEAVMDRVIMNYFHQEDLVEEQKSIFKREAARTGSRTSQRSTTSVPRSRNVRTGKYSNISGLGAMLLKFDPKHIRLGLNYVKGSEGDMGPSRIKDEDNTKAFNPQIFKEQFHWKKRKNEMINLAKVCSPPLMVKRFMQSDPKHKKEQSIDLINFLVQLDTSKQRLTDDGQDLIEVKPRMRKKKKLAVFSDDQPQQLQQLNVENEEETEAEEKEEDKKNQWETTLRRCFFHFSNKQDAVIENRFQEINLQNFVNFFCFLAGKQPITIVVKTGSATAAASSSNAVETMTTSKQLAQRTSAFTANVSSHRSSTVGITKTATATATVTPVRKVSTESIEESQRLRANSRFIHQRQREEEEDEEVIILKENITLKVLLEIFKKLTKGPSIKQVLSYFSFLQAVRKVSIAFHQSEVQQRPFERKDSYMSKSVTADAPILQPTAQDLFERFFMNQILPKAPACMDGFENEINKYREEDEIDELMLFFERSLKDLFLFTGSLRSSSAGTNASSSSSSSTNNSNGGSTAKYLTFHEIFEIVQKLDLFPNRISKNTMRYLYFYTKTADQGLTFTDFLQCFHLIALTIIRSNSAGIQSIKTKAASSRSESIFQECTQIQIALFQLRQDNKLNNGMINFIQDIALFYLHPELLDINHLQKRIATLKDSTVQIQQAL